MSKAVYAVTALILLYSAVLLADVDIVKGKTLLKENCYACHDDEIYVRKNRIIDSYSKLEQRVRFCSTQRNLTWFDDDIENVAAYLNKEFYHFKQ